MYILTHEKIKFDTIVEHVKIVYYELKRIITSPSHMTYIYIYIYISYDDPEFHVSDIRK